jgi:hypothetical protein
MTSASRRGSPTRLAVRQRRPDTVGATILIGRRVAAAGRTASPIAGRAPTCIIATPFQ